MELGIGWSPLIRSQEINTTSFLDYLVNYRQEIQQMATDRTHQEPNWEDLMELAQAGNQKAYHDLLSALYDRFQTYLEYRINDFDTMEDILMVAMEGIHQSRHTYKPGKPFLAWAYSILKYKLADHYRTQARQSEIFTIAKADLPVYDGKDVQLQIESLLNTLDDRDRQLISKVKLEGYSYREAGEQLDMSESNVKVTVHRIMNRLAGIA